MSDLHWSDGFGKPVDARESSRIAMPLDPDGARRHHRLSLAGLFGHHGRRTTYRATGMGRVKHFLGIGA
ncbi:hypothetical protein [Herbiconiux sp. L3-i23]|uniref:hypothetical protein n=1 Tax=Herbiconiux sp. L3-i23 TaxID=2905871 RepID=UPI00206D6083|nr:hypothetical protein [Herbiconiux sp. L3-i23]BDI23193.1 hypothetical protein L3i23_19690 [Herbiconiux sp. L3-i23]